MPIGRETEREAEVLDGFAECMGHEYRRKILFSLHESARDEYLLVPDDLLESDLERDRLFLQLVHHHVPKLEEWEFVSWDRESQVVERGEEFGRIEPLLDVLSEHYDQIVPRFDRSSRRR